jgi:bifunctional UDP-N-acetylglucosamine pyrophosphorylase/glucosamine-1-phosphate N-acetyltransferase
MKVSAIVIAAGLGTRMKSELPKVLHPLCGQPLLMYVLDTLFEAKVSKIVVVVNHRKEAVIAALRDRYGIPKKQHQKKPPFIVVDQKKPLGTAHAVLVAERYFKDAETTVAILNGDNPSLRPETVKNFFDFHIKNGADLTVASAMLDEKIPYGRIVKNSDGELLKIVEAREADPEQLKIREMNVGLYCASSAPLFSALKKITPDNAKKEYYLTDLIPLMGKKAVYLIENEVEALGINDRYELSQKERYLRDQINKAWMLKGVTMIDPQTTYISPQAGLGTDVVLYPQVHIEGKSVIGKGTTIGVGAIVRDSQIGGGATIKSYSIIEESRVDDGAVVGPFARIRPESHLKKGSRVGSFVELKKTILGEKSKANHLTYLGDAEIGKEVNVGCGVITCNYDGNLRYDGKAKTKIGDHSFIGSDVQLVAPVTLKEGAYVASGSTVTEDVPKDSLVISRVPQVTKKGYMKKMWARAKKRGK